MLNWIKKALQKLNPRAQEIAANEQKRHKLLHKALDKLPRLRQGGAISDIIEDIRWLIHMLKSYFTGAYQQIPWETVLVIIAALIYFVSPLDLLPDFLPGGIVDDAAVFGFVLKTVRKDIELYKTWLNSSRE